MYSLFQQVDMHSVHFHGQILSAENHHTDTISLFPASSTTAEMVADNPGKWLLTCNVNDHMMGELISSLVKCQLIKKCLLPIWLIFQLLSVAYSFELLLCGFVQLGCRLYLRSRSVSLTSISLGHMVKLDSTSLLQKRRFGTMLRHSPLTGWLLNTHPPFHLQTHDQRHFWCFFYGENLPFLLCVHVCVCREAETFVTKGRNRIGSKYKKVRYVEYTDNTFTTKMLRSAQEQHLGILGNTGEVGVGKFNKKTIVRTALALIAGA